MKIGQMRRIILPLGDIAVFYLALISTLFIRYGIADFQDFWTLHQLPFLVIFVIWIIIFMIAGLYDPDALALNQVIRERIFRAMLAAAAIAIMLFYAIPAFGITPKTNLVIQLTISIFLLFMWRWAYGIILARRAKTRILFSGFPSETTELISYLESHPQLGYEFSSIALPEGSIIQPPSGLPVHAFDHNLPNLIRTQKIDLIVAAEDIRQEKDFVKMLYTILPLGITFIDFPKFYERITGRIPVSLISEIWFLENLAETEKRVFEVVKRGFDIFASLVLGLITLAFFPLIALVIKLESRDPIFFQQKRVGKNGHTFRVIKFRTMIKDAEQGQALWAKENDARVTRVGRFLRRTRLDELPQLWNVLKGDMSLIGPRPERPEFVEELKKEVPHYLMRLLVRPGLSGWAQINFPYGASVEDALKKLQYDLYYIKHRSFGLDIVITLKTIATLLSQAGR